MNKIMLVGRLVQDPELKTAQTGNAYCNYKVAVNYGKDKNGGEIKPDYIPCTSFGKQAETICQHIGKGCLVSIVGRLKVQSSKNPDGTWNNYTSVNVEDINFLSYKNEQQGVAAQQGQQYAQAQQPQQQYAQAQQPQQQYAPQQPQPQYAPQQPQAQTGFIPAGDFDPQFGFDPNVPL